MDSVAEPGFANETLSARIAAAIAAIEALAAELTQPQQAGDVLLAEHRLEHLHRLIGATHPSAATTNRGNPSGCLKQKGFTVTRDPHTGRWRTYRPDGNVIR